MDSCCPPVGRRAAGHWARQAAAVLASPSPKFPVGGEAPDEIDDGYIRAPSIAPNGRAGGNIHRGNAFSGYFAPCGEGADGRRTRWAGSSPSIFICVAEGAGEAPIQLGGNWLGYLPFPYCQTGEGDARLNARRRIRVFTISTARRGREGQKLNARIALRVSHISSRAGGPEGRLI